MSRDTAYPIESNYASERGLTKREIFAAMVLQGILSNSSLAGAGIDSGLAKMAVQLADTLEDELKK